MMKFPRVIDSSIRKEFRLCETRAMYSYFRGIEPKGGSIHLHFGGCFARGLERVRLAYYGEGQSVLDSLAEGAKAIILSWGDYEPPIDGNKNLASCLVALYEYFKQYPLPDDPIRPLMIDGKPAVEWTFALPIPGTRHPDTGEPILYGGRFDILANYGSAVFVVDDKTASQLGASWAKQWKLASQMTGYCVIGETEVLTEFGWKAIKLLKEGEKIAQWDNGKVSFVAPTAIHRPKYKGKLISMEGKCSLVATPDHEQLIYVRHLERFKKFKMIDIPRNSGALTFRSAGIRVDGLELPYDFVEFLAAMQADGSWMRSADNTKIGARFHFSKERKYEKLISLLENLETEYKTQDRKQGTKAIILPLGSDLCELAHAYLGPDKRFSSAFFSLDGGTLRHFISELRYWDGSDYGDNKWMYFSTCKENVEMIRDLAPLAGLHVSIHQQGGWKSKKPQYRAVITTKIKHDVSLHTWGEVDYDGIVYCVTVPSHNFLVRHNKKVIVTGNCWAGKQFGYPVQGAIIRGVGILKTSITHQMCIENRDQWMIDRWLVQLKRDIDRMIRCYESGVWDLELDHACGTYGGCPFLTLCTSRDPEEWVDTYYEPRHWDPLWKEAS